MSESYFYGGSREKMAELVSYMRANMPSVPRGVSVWVVGGVARKGWSQKDIDLFIEGSDFMGYRFKQAFEDLVTRTNNRFRVVIDVFDDWDSEGRGKPPRLFKTKPHFLLASNVWPGDDI